MSANNAIQLSAEKVLAIKNAAAAAADSAKAVADKGTKLPVAQWAKRDQYETEGTKMLVDLLNAGYVVTGLGKAMTNKSGEVSANFKIGLPQCGLEEKVANYVTTMENARARRKAAREAKKAGAAAPAVKAPAVAAKPTNGTGVSVLAAAIARAKKAA
jgi:hypothetical protein